MAVTYDFELKKGSNKRSIQAALKSTNLADDFSDVESVVFYMRPSGASVNTIDGAAGSYTLDAATKYLITAMYTFTDADVDTPGRYQCYFKALFPGGKSERFPSNGYKTVLITDDFEA